MAFVKTTQNKDDELLSTVAAPASGTPVTTGNASGSKAAPVATPTSPAAASNTSGGWTNLSSYLTANKPQAAGLGQSVAQTIDKETGEARSAITGAEQQFGTKVAENRLNFDQAALDSTIATGRANEQVQNQLAGEYAGPKSLQEAGLAAGVNKEVGEAATKGALTKDVGGRIELLRGSSENPQTTGNLKLNQLFLQNNPDAAGAIKAAAERAAPLTAEQEAANLRGQQAVEAEQAQAATVADRTKGAITDVLGTAATERETALANEKVRLQREQEAAKAYLAQLSNAPGASTFERSNMVQPATLGTDGLPTGWEAAGLTIEQAQSLAERVKQAAALGETAPNLNDYYTAEDVSGLTQANIVSPEEAARITALAELVGQQGITAGSRLDRSGNFNLTGAQQGLDAMIAAARTRSEAAAANRNILDQQASANAAQLAAQNRAAKSAATTGTVVSAASGAAAGFAVGGPVGAVIGGVLGAVFCFEQNTPVTMADGTVKLIKDIQIGDAVLLGGTVLGTGRTVVDELVSYKGLFMTPTHVLYHEGEDGKNYWTTAGAVGEPVDITSGYPVVCPLITKAHLIVTGDVISADVMTVPAEADPDWSMNHTDRMQYLAEWKERNSQLDDLIALRKVKVEKLLCSM